jgi:hypothetical protein
MLTLISRILSVLLQTVGRLSRIELIETDIRVSQARTEATLQLMQGQLVQILDQLLPGPAVGFIFTADLEGQLSVGVTQMNITDSQQVSLSIQPVDKKGNAAAVDGAPQWASSNTEVVTVTPSADGLSAIAAAVGPLGTATVSVTADADLGAGVTSIAGTLDVTVTAGQAATVSITAGTPTDQA